MEVGTQIDQYVIVEHIGRGGMADVWSARDERLQRTVAIKTISAHLTDEQARFSFEREARTIAALEHSNILPIYDIGEFQRQVYIVMRYVSGGSLMDRLIEGPLSDVEVIRIGDAISSALERAHAERVVHRDLKPANVLLDNFGVPYLADFGLAIVAGTGTDEHTSAGTLLYMPPEQAFGEPVDHRADVYAFGVMLFQMITGEFPFEAQAALCLRQVQEGDELPDPRKYRPDLPQQLVTVLRVATAQDVAARYDSAGLLMSEVEAALAGKPSLARGTVEAVGPAQEPVPYDLATETSVSVDEDMIVTMPGVPKEEMLVTIDVDSEKLYAEVVSRPRAEAGEFGEEALEEEEEGAAGEPPALREAHALFRRMVRAWAHGQGKFVTSATHYADIFAYYSQADVHGLEIDPAGYEALLRGAIEHHYELDFCLGQVPDLDVQRKVCLHALRSDLAAARALTVRLLKDLPDSEGQNVALSVGRLLHSETDPDVRRAIVELLAVRADRATAWREDAYTVDTDLLLAEQALRTDVPDVAEMAARAVGRLRSRVAVEHIAAQEARFPAQVRAALAWVRDEADDLPPTLPFGQRARAFSRLTGHYLTAHIGRLGLRYFTALLGAGLGMGLYVHFSFNTELSLLSLLHLYRVVANAQTFGLVAGLGVMLAAALPLRLAGSSAQRPDGATLWRGWARLLVSLVGGGLITGVAYLNFQMLALQFQPSDIAVPTVFLGGLSMVLGAAVASTFRWPLWARLLVTALLLFSPLYATCFHTAEPLLYFRDGRGLWCSDVGSSDIWSQGGALAILTALGAYGPELLDAFRSLLRRGRPAEPTPTPEALDVAEAEGAAT